MTDFDYRRAYLETSAALRNLADMVAASQARTLSPSIVEAAAKRGLELIERLDAQAECARAGVSVLRAPWLEPSSIEGYADRIASGEDLFSVVSDICRPKVQP